MQEKSRDFLGNPYLYFSQLKKPWCFIKFFFTPYFKNKHEISLIKHNFRHLESANYIIQKKITSYRKETNLQKEEIVNCKKEIALQKEEIIDFKRKIAKQKGELSRLKAEVLDQKKKNLQQDKILASYFYTRGMRLSQSQKYQDAREDIELALQFHPRNKKFLLQLSKIFRQMGNYDDAALTLEKVLELDVDNPVLMSVREQLLLRKEGAGAFQSEYYDVFYSTSEAYSVGAEDSLYFSVWAHIADCLRVNTESLLDFGCGPGQFAEFLHKVLPDVSYTGFDFSKVAISQAQVRCPYFRFEHAALPLEDYSNFLPFDTVICTEVLEHIENDLALLSSIPQGTRLVLSVPNYDSDSHVRFFIDQASVLQRYSSFFDDFNIQEIKITASSIIWVLDGIKKRN